MSFFDKAKAAASQAAAKAKQSAEDLQLKVDLGSAYDDLGQAAFTLIESGEIAHPKLEEPAAKVRELRRRMEGGGKADPDAPEVTEAAEPASAPDASEPSTEGSAAPPEAPGPGTAADTPG